MEKLEEYEVNRPDVERSSTLADEARRQEENSNVAGAIALINEAMLLDPIAGLNDYVEIRVRLYDSIGRQAPLRAAMLYSVGYLFSRRGNVDDARLAYEAAHSLDPLFLWPINNIAWMIATDENSSACDGRQAMSFARTACEESNWSCWAFLGTLASAYACAHDFERAVGWQRATLPLVPDDHRSGSVAILRCFEKGEVHVNKDHPVAAGDLDCNDEFGEMDDAELRKYVRELMGIDRTGIH